MIDTHCHPQFPQYENEKEDLIKRTLDGGVKIICVGTDLETSKEAVAIARSHAGVWAAIGLHPSDSLDEAFDSEAYYQLGQDKKVVAFGEIGLDYRWAKEDEAKNAQKKRFIQQIKTASELNLPLIIHCRDAHQDMLDLLNQNKKTLRELPGVIHSFTDKWEIAQKYIDLGFYIGLNGIITFTDEYNETVKKTPLDRILLETDAPLLAPPPFRGKRNEPLYVKYVAKHIVKLRNISIEEVDSVTTQNAIKLFNLKQ